MRDEMCGRCPCRHGASLAVAAMGLLAACGSQPSASPGVPITPLTTRAFVHVLDQGQKVLSTFMVDPRTGDLSLVDTRATPGVSSASVLTRPLVADARGRFIYLSEKDWVRGYRADASSGALTLVSDVSAAAIQRTLGISSLRSLAVSPGRLYVDGTSPMGSHHHYYCLGALTVDQSGVLAGAKLIVRDLDDQGGSGYRGILTTDQERDVILANYYDDYLCALRADWSTGGAGYRELARLTFDGSYYDDQDQRPVGGPRACTATGGRVLLVDGKGRLFSFVLDEAAGRFEQRGFVPNAGVPYTPIMYGVPGRLAVVTKAQSVALYTLGTDGTVSFESALPERYFSSIGSMAFHPSGRFLYVCGVPSDGSPWGSVVSTASYLLTFSISPDGGVTLFGSLPVAGCGPVVVTAPAS